jgi:hypothetical protein
VFSYPPHNAVSRLFVAAENLIFRLLRKEFRSFAHPWPGCSPSWVIAGSGARSLITGSCGR